ncbi:MAG: hypothetical protein ACREVW_07260 [Burkholderiales bacterium]
MRPVQTESWRNTCRTPGAGADAPTFEGTTTPNAKQKRALELIE